ncbi:MAG: RNA polymerase-binding protein DksA [Candidatus Thiodiazotropha sp. L084R]
MSILTESELLASAESDYMCAEQLEFFRARLLQEEQALLVAVHKTKQHLQEIEVTPDLTDRASNEEDLTLEVRMRDRERKLLKKIREALKRIDDGSYGWCEETDEHIGLARLLARPTATLCLQAQERYEQVKRQFSG